VNSGYLLHHLLGRNDLRPQQPAVVDGDVAISYETLVQEADRIAAALGAVGLERGDRVAVHLERGAAECAAVFGISRADGVFVPVHAALRENQVSHILKDAGARVLVTSSKFLKKIAPVVAGCDSLAAVISVDGIGEYEFDGARLVSLSEAGDAGNVVTTRAIGEDLAAILYTSGSTGLPKGVMLSHRNLLAGTRIVRTYLGITASDRILSVLPFSFDYGLNQLLTSVEQGACIVPFTFQFGDQIVAALVRHEITGLAGVPTIWSILTRAAPSLPGIQLPRLRYITNSGGAVPSATVKRLRELLPTTKIFLMYGLTEAFRSSFLAPEEVDRRPTSIGKAIPETELFVVGHDGNRVPPGVPGILVHRGPTVSLGYWKRPEDTAMVIRRNPLRPRETGGDLVCVSGDLVVQDEEGFFYFVGREDGMIKSSGFRISPTEVEGVLVETGLFQQVAVIGLPDALLGQRVHAVAVAAASDIDTGVAIKACSESLAAYMVPREIELVDVIPLTPNGKVDYKRLVAERLVDES
jgi:acyl-CoA ligase (AMP-forming) (exosortase A-associated)